MKEPYKDFIRDVLITLHMNLKELQERRNFADPEEQAHIEARTLAYKELLDILRDSAREFKIDTSELGL